MRKNEIASYLLTLHGLIEAQTKGAHSVASTSLADEYEKNWKLLKEAIAKEKEDENRQFEEPEDRAYREAGQRTGGFADRNNGGNTAGKRAAVSGSGVSSATAQDDGA